MSMIKKYRGFTLVELIVSLGLFTIVVTIVMTAFLRMIALDKVARATNDVTTNLAFVTDSMSRGIRTGTTYICNDGLNPDGINCLSGANKFSYTDDQEPGKIVTYGLFTDQVSGFGYVGQCYDLPSISCGLPNTVTQMNDPRINVQALNFYVRGVDDANADSLQPQVTFTLKGSITPSTGAVPILFSIEGGATQRQIDL